MNKLLFLLLALSMIACEGTRDTPSQMHSEGSVDDWAKKSSIYEVNIRQYTPEGNFNAFLPYLDTLKDLGVDILWFMPIQPIGVLNRKGEIGSYYSIKNYTTINPDFGTKEDFKKLVEQAHAKGFKVILDWVPNHTAWDHAWVEEHPEYYTQDSAGNRPIVPAGTDWTDVAELNYDNYDLQEEMIQALKYWVGNYQIDGYRCDQAGLVPMEFWIKAVDTLKTIKPILMLAEWQDPKMHRAFHMTYTWEFHHELKQIVEEGNPQRILKARMEAERQKYPDTAYRMVFTTNHDENSWKKTVFERYGDNVAPITVLTFTLFGTPLVYSGQEIGLNKSLRFFEKDTIHWRNSHWRGFYKKLLALNENKKALWGGGYGAQAEWIESPPGTVAYSRSIDGEGIIVYLNFNDESMDIELEDIVVETYMTDEETIVEGNTIHISGHGYYIGETEKN